VDVGPERASADDWHCLLKPELLAAASVHERGRGDSFLAASCRISLLPEAGRVLPGQGRVYKVPTPERGATHES
jgi:hypothetical protein